MLLTEKADDIDDGVFFFQAKCIQLPVQLLETLFDVLVIQSVEFAVMAKEHFQNGEGIAVSKVRWMSSNIAS